MEPSAFQNECFTLIESSRWIQKLYKTDDVILTFSEPQLFTFFNLLGEELGIDLSLLTAKQRALLLEHCQTDAPFSAKEFTALLWLIFYSDMTYH